MKFLANIGFAIVVPHDCALADGIGSNYVLSLRYLAIDSGLFWFWLEDELSVVEIDVGVGCRLASRSNGANSVAR